MPKCQNCDKEFPRRFKKDGKIWNLSRRNFCPECSPLGEHNRRPYIVATEPGKAFCARCQQSKDRKDFHNRKGGQKPLSYCRSCSEEVKNLKLQEKLDKGVVLKGGVCADCGGVFPVSVFLFVRKDNTILLTTKIKHMSWERLKENLEDCEMLCRNCIVMRKWANNA